MLKAVYLALALLALLFAALGGGWNVASGGAPAFEMAEHVQTSEHTEASEHADHADHVAPRDPSSIDDDDDDVGDDGEMSSMLTRPGADDDDRDDTDAEGDGDASALPPIAGAARIPSLAAAGALVMTPQGLRPAGEHRASADRPPRV